MKRFEMLGVLMLCNVAFSIALPRHPLTHTDLLGLDTGIHRFNDSVALVRDSALNPRTIGHENVNEEDWKKAVAKGCTLLQQMEASDHDAGQMFKDPVESAESQFKTFPGDLEKWGYAVAAYDDFYDFDLSIPIKKALEDLKLDTKKQAEGGNNVAFYWEHENEKTVDGVVYKPTGASFIMVMNPQDGVIMSLGSYSPAYQGSKKDPPITVLPKLKAYSDITFLQWNGLPGRTDIKYIFRTPIENADTEALAKQALSNVGKELGTWPGVTFDMDTAEGKAMLGSPNGAGCAFLLVQHKAQLGMKTIDKVTIFQDDGAKKPRPPSMVFHVTDVETPEEHDASIESRELESMRTSIISDSAWWEIRREW